VRDTRSELFYLTTGHGGLVTPVNITVSTGSTSVMSVDVESAGGTLKVSAPKVVFEGDARIIRATVATAGSTSTASQNFEVSADGQRFLLLLRPASATPQVENPVTVLLNWTAALAK